MMISLCCSHNKYPDVEILCRQCKDAIKAVKRRLQHKSSRVQLLTLTVHSFFLFLTNLSSLGYNYMQLLTPNTIFVSL